MRSLFLLTCFISTITFAQNPVSFTYYRPGGTPALYATPDTVTTTVTGKRTGGWFSSGVALTSTTVVKPYKSPVIQPPVNNAPTVSLGADRTIQLATGETSASVLINASVTDESITTLKYQWTNGATSSSITVPQPVGTVSYSVTVTDNGGKTATDEVKVTVLAPTTTPPPVDPPPTTDGWPTWTPFSENDFTTSLTKGFNKYIQQPDRATTMTLSNDFGKSMKIDITRQQCIDGGNFRSELTLIDVETITAGTESWYTFDMYLPNYQSDNEESIFQIHQSAGTGSPPSALYITQNKLAYNYITTFNGSERYYGTRWELPINKWFNVKFHYKWGNTDATGLTELWIDGKLVMSLKAANIYSGQTNYTKLGLYKWPWNPKSENQAKVLKRTLYYGNWKAWKK